MSNKHDSFNVWLVNLSSMKFLIGYYLMSNHNVISDYKYTQYNIIKLIIQFNFFLITEFDPNNL